MKHARIVRIISFSVLVLLALFLGSCAGSESRYQGENLLAITKSASPTVFSKAGDMITYTYEVKALPANIKNNTTVDDPAKIEVFNIAIVDSPLDGPALCPMNSLIVGASMQCTATYTITEQDVINGSVTNNATVSGDFWLQRDGCSILGVSKVLHQTTAGAPGVTVTLDPSASVPPAPVEVHPKLTLVKSAEPTSFLKVTKLIKFTFTITNTGDVPIEGQPFILTDSLKVTDVNCPLQTLAVGESVSCTAWYTVQFSDFNKPIKNCATIAGTYADPVAGLQVVTSNNSCVNVYYQPPKNNEAVSTQHVP